MKSFDYRIFDSLIYLLSFTILEQGYQDYGHNVLPMQIKYN